MWATVILIVSLLASSVLAAPAYNKHAGWLDPDTFSFTAGQTLVCDDTKQCSFGSYVPAAADYSNLTGGTGIDNSPTGTLAMNLTEITCGEGIRCASATSIDTVSEEAGFLEIVGMTCGAGGTGAGSLVVTSTVLNFCDATATDRYVALGDSVGNALILAEAGDEADAGPVRLINASTGVCFEAAPAGTDECMTLDSSERFTFTGPVSADTGFQISGVATDDAVLQGNGTNYVATAVANCTSGSVRYATATNAWSCAASAGTGDVSGPAAAVTDNALVRWDGTGGTTVQNSVGTLSDVGLLSTDVFSSDVADPADAGVVRIGNAESIAAEASPAGTDGTITFDASEIWQIEPAMDSTAITEGGVGVPNVNDNLSVFAATTSAQLAGVINNETGSGLLVFATAPTFLTNITTPAIDTGTSDAADNVSAIWCGGGGGGSCNSNTRGAYITVTGNEGGSGFAPGIILLTAGNVGNVSLQTGSTTTTRFYTDTNGNVITGSGSAEIATSATNGFFYMPTTNGAPTGDAAVDVTGARPCVFDRANFKLCCNTTSTTWKCTAAMS